MPLFDFLCPDCGKISEILVSASQDDEDLTCPACSAAGLKRLLSAHSSLSGSSGQSMPGAGDTACCGSSPGHANCAGPGSCCGKGPQ